MSQLDIYNNVFEERFPSATMAYRYEGTIVPSKLENPIPDWVQHLLEEGHLAMANGQLCQYYGDDYIPTGMIIVSDGNNLLDIITEEEFHDTYQVKQLWRAYPIAVPPTWDPNMKKFTMYDAMFWLGDDVLNGLVQYLRRGESRNRQTLTRKILDHLHCYSELAQYKHQLQDAACKLSNRITAPLMQGDKIAVGYPPRLPNIHPSLLGADDLPRDPAERYRYLNKLYRETSGVSSNLSAVSVAIPNTWKPGGDEFTFYDALYLLGDAQLNKMSMYIDDVEIASRLKIEDAVRTRLKDLLGDSIPDNLGKVSQGVSDFITPVLMNGDRIEVSPGLVLVASGVEISADLKRSEK